MTTPPLARTILDALLSPLPPRQREWAARLIERRVIASFATLGDTVVLTVDAFRYMVVDIARWRFHWREFVAQAWFVASVAAIPTMLTAIPFGVIVSVQVGNIASQVGANSFMGAANGLGVLRQGAPLVTALLLAGAVGSAITSDLGARKIREEIDAIETMGLSPVQRLVAPRLAAVLVVSVLLCGLVVFMGIGTGYVFNTVALGGVPGSYVDTLANFAQPGDLVLAEVKSVVFGGIVAVVAANKGLSASGGPKGVADAVNSAVVLAVVVLFAVNVIITQLYNTLFPPRLV